uniref:Uncharacterized protein n=1 Tax=Plectus sambesii TaxID=2011161 RepID=A0A914XMB3_9BILA
MWSGWRALSHPLEYQGDAEQQGGALVVGTGRLSASVQRSVRGGGAACVIQGRTVPIAPVRLHDNDERGLCRHDYDVGRPRRTPSTWPCLLMPDPYQSQLIGRLFIRVPLFQTVEYCTYIAIVRHSITLAYTSFWPALTYRCRPTFFRDF